MSTRTERGWARAWLAVLVVPLLAAVVVGGYLGGWWLQGDVQNRQAHLRRSTFEQQTTYRDEMIRKIADVRAVDAQVEQASDDPALTSQLRAQRRAIVDIVCRDNTHINGGLDRATAAFVERECS